MKNKIDKVLDKYWDGKSSIEEEQILKTYFDSADVASEHEPFKEWFDWTKDASVLVAPIDTDIDLLLEKYWEATTSVKEEKVLRAYFNSGQVADHHLPYIDLFAYYEDQSQITYPGKIVQMHPDKNQRTDTNGSKVVSLRRWLGAAASVVVLGLAIVMLLNNEKSNQVELKPVQFAAVQEIEDPEEALRITKEALAMLATKLSKSEMLVSQNMANLDKAVIFK